MASFFREGGLGMWFVLLFGLMALVGAILFARRPEEKKLGFLRAMSASTGFCALAGFTAGLARSTQAARYAPPDKWPIYVAIGFGEALALIVLASALLSLVWFVTAIGQRRLAARDPGA